MALRGVWAAAPDDVWAVGVGGTLLHFDGRTWSATSSPVTVSLASVWGSGPADVWAAGECGTLLHYDGGSWSQMVSGTTAPLDILSGTAADDVWASTAAIPVRPQITTGGPAPGAVLLHYDGHAWKQVEVDAPTAVAALSRDDVWVGSSGALRHFDGSSWTTFAAPGGFVRTVVGLHGGPVFATTQHQVPCSPKSGVICGADTLLRFDGSAWTETDGPWGEYVAGAGRVWNVDSNQWVKLTRYDGNGWVTLAFSLEFDLEGWEWPPVVGPVSDEKAWIVGEHGRRMFFDGTGLSEPDAFRTNNILAMAGSSECDVWAVGNEALVLHRGCDGTWSSIDLVAAGVVPADPAHGYVGARQLGSVTTLGPDAVWILSSDKVLHFDGATWSAEAAPASGKLFAAGREDLYLAGNDGVFHRDGSGWHHLFGGGSEFTRVGESMRDVWASSPNDVWVKGLDYTDRNVVIHHFDGAGWSTSLRRPWAYGQQYLRDAISGSGPDDVWVAGGEFLHFDGSSWKTVPVPGAYDVFTAGRGEAWVNGYDANASGLYLVDASGWRPHYSGAPGRLFATGATIFGYGGGGAILSRPK